jgi:hypothetical protein
LGAAYSGWAAGRGNTSLPSLRCEARGARSTRRRAPRSVPSNGRPGNKRRLLPISSSAEAACGLLTRRIAMLSKITLALVLAFAVGSVLPASAGPRTCGSNMIQYDSSGTWTGPYCG